MEESTYWLEEAPVFKAIKHTALPMIFAMAIGTIYNFTDTLFIGFLGDTSALAAVSLCLPYLAVVKPLFALPCSVLPPAASSSPSAEPLYRCSPPIVPW